MHLGDGPVPNEEPLPPPEKPFTVLDNRFTLTQTADRAVLAKCIELLAERVKKALEEDSIRNQRFVRRLRLVNKSSNPNGRNHERYLVKLPIEANCWNDVDVVDLEIRIIKAVRDNVEDQNHTWYHVRIMCDDFLDLKTKEYLDRFDRGESLSPETTAGQPEPVRESQAPSTSKSNSQQMPHLKKTKKRKPHVLTIDVEDSDDDVIVLD